MFASAQLCVAAPSHCLREAAGSTCERVALIIHCTQLRGSKLMNKTLRDIRPRRVFTRVIGSPPTGGEKILVRLESLRLKIHHVCFRVPILSSLRKSSSALLSTSICVGWLSFTDAYFAGTEKPSKHSHHHYKLATKIHFPSVETHEQNH